jgi:hypothetical protein
MLNVHQKYVYGEFKSIASNNETHLGLHVKCPTFMPDFKKIEIFSTDFPWKYQMWNFTKIRPVEAVLIRADRRTDITELEVLLWKEKD